MTFDIRAQPIKITVDEYQEFEANLKSRENVIKKLIPPLLEFTYNNSYVSIRILYEGEYIFYDKESFLLTDIVHFFYVEILRRENAK